MSKKPALGRGLAALLENTTVGEADKLALTPSDKDNPRSTIGSVASLPISKIEANPFQPRTEFEKKSLEELTNSIKELGIIQPVTVRQLQKDKYQLISGERRFRAAQIAELTEIPAFIRVANDQEMLEMALVENIQRENLDEMEVAFSYQKLIEDCQLTQEKLSQRVGKNRSTIANYLRLLKLPATIQLALRTKEVTMGHARSLISIEDTEQQTQIFNSILKKGLSVRQTEELVQQLKNTAPKANKKEVKLSEASQTIQADLSTSLTTEVFIQENDKGKGKIVIPFGSPMDLKRIAEAIAK